MKLVVVESPAKSKTISKILGPDYTVRATYGHIIDLPTGKGTGLAIDIDNGFVPKYEVIPDKRDKVRAILDAARASDQIFLASDADREGEMISHHVASQLDKLGIPMKRITFSEITPAAIKKAVANPRDIDEHLVKAQMARRVLDRIVGFMASPYISKLFGDVGLSAGRVQSVALRLIVDREKEIESFVPETYFTIDVTLSKGKDKFVARLTKKITTDDEAKKAKEDLLKAKYTVTSVVAEQKQVPPPPPLTTAKLQQEASAKYKLPVERTSKAAQSLYEDGLVTYIRTDSVRSSPESVEALREYIKAQGFGLPGSPNTFKNKDASQDAHEAIRPTDVKILKPNLVDDDQKKVYELIWTMFVASQMTPVVNDVVQVTLTTDNGYELKADGKIQKDAGWLKVADAFVKKTKDVVLPSISKGDSPGLVDPKVVVDKKKTQPASRFNDGTLVKELERKDIGRPSTYASIIARIANRKYVVKTAKGFQPTDLGRKVSDELMKFFSFMDYKYTAHMEKKLDKMAEGKLDYVEMLTEFFNEFKKEFHKARGSQGQVLDFPCPICGDSMVVRKSSFGFFAGCVKYPECKTIIGISIDNGVVTRRDTKPQADESIKCPDCDSGMVLRTDGRFGPFYSCSRYPKCLGKRKVPFGKKCPKCNNELFATLFNDVVKLACMGYPNCKHVENLPEGAEVNWANPEKITPPKYSNKVEKVLKK
jgi:DNA topoisomerase-1